MAYVLFTQQLIFNTKMKPLFNTAQGQISALPLTGYEVTKQVT